jgi:hypothetical protein
MIETILGELDGIKKRLERLEAQEHTHTILNEVIKITDDGGLAIKLVAGETLVQGNIVNIKQSGGADGKVWKTPTSGDERFMPIGVALEAANANASVWIVVAGKAKVLPESGLTATRGYVVFASSSEAGRADDSATLPTTDHWAECGHWLYDGTGNGVLTLAVLHFN